MTLSPGRSPCTIRPSAGYISGRSDGCGELTSRPKGLDRVGDRGRVPFDALSLLVPVLGPSPSRGPSLPVLAGGPPGTRTLNPPTRRVPAEDELAPIPITRASNPELASPTRRSGTRHNTHTERRISRADEKRRTAHMRSWRSTHRSPVPGGVVMVGARRYVRLPTSDLRGPPRRGWFSAKTRTRLSDRRNCLILASE